jgi:hypothetical protein
MSEHPDEQAALLQQQRGAPTSSRGIGTFTAKIYVASALIILAACTAVAYMQDFNSDAYLSEIDARDLKKKNKKNKHQDTKCLDDKKYSSHTAKTAYEMPFAALFKDTRGEKKFEASSVINLDGTYYAICDNSWAISKFESDLTPFSENNLMIGDPNREAEDSGYEAIFYHDNIFYVMRESVEHGSDSNTSYHAIIEELVVTGDDYEIKDQCSCEFEFEGTRCVFILLPHTSVLNAHQNPILKYLSSHTSTLTYFL